MTRIHDSGPRRLVRGVTATALGIPLLAVAGPLAPLLPPTTGAHAVTVGAVTRTPALTISVADGRHTVKPSDLLSYTVRIRNIGTANAPGLDIVQTLPPGMTLTSISPAGAAHDGHVTWQVNLAAGGEDTFHVAGRAGPERGQLLRLATIACASTRGSVRPIVCAAHLDQLPARAPQATATAVGGPPTGYVRPLAVTLVLVAAAAAGGSCSAGAHAAHLDQCTSCIEALAVCLSAGGQPGAARPAAQAARGPQRLTGRGADAPASGATLDVTAGRQQAQ